MTYFYEESSLKGKEAIGFVNGREGICIFSTVNEDGTANGAIFVPRFIEDGNYLQVGLANNTSRKNILERKSCYVTCVKYNKKEEDKFKRTIGLHMKCEYVGGEENNLLIRKYSVKDYSIFLKIKEILPIG